MSETSEEEDNFIELMEMLIGWKIFKNKSVDDWREYMKKNDYNYVKILGLKILLKGEVMGMMKNKSEKEVQRIFVDFISYFSEYPYLTEHLLVQLCTYMSAKMDSDCEEWNQHQVVCWVVKWIVAECGDKWCEKTCDCLADYLGKLINSTFSDCSVKWIILNFENWLLKANLSSSTRSKLIDALRSHTSYLSQLNITSDYEHLVLERYQVGWCAQWTTDNVLEDEERMRNRKQMPLIKLSRDRFEVRNDNDEPWSIPVRSSFGVTSGVSYYEVIALTEGEMRFGWATRETNLSTLGQIGDDEHSIGLEVGSKCCIYHDSKTISNPTFYQSRSVIGCLIDIENEQFKFYINGKEIEMNETIRFSTKKYYATANLSYSQQCLFNFGQTPFKCPSKDIGFFSKEDINYQLVKTFEYKNRFWFAHTPIASHVDTFFSDPEQVDCDDYVRQLEHIESNQTTGLDQSVECGRLIQSVIEVVDRRLTCGNNDLLSSWLREAIGRIEHRYFDRTKLLELLYPYLQLPINPINSTKCHNTCLIVTMMYFNDPLFAKGLITNTDFFSQTIETFINPKTFITDPRTMLFALNCFKLIQLSTIEIFNNEAIVSTLWWCSELFDHVSSVSQLYNPSCDLLRLQAGMFARWFRDYALGVQHFPSQSTLNPEDKGQHIKLSSDCLSARNVDYHDRWQIVCSVSAVSSGIFYYEAVLLTDGKMRIGWATKQSELRLNGIGRDKYSIGYDGSVEHEIYHKKNNFYANSLIYNFTSKPQWSVGDIVGCLIDCDNKIFQFYLNGKLIEIKEIFKDEDGDEHTLHFSENFYYAAVCLGRQQQCYLNFGQGPFKYPPKYVQFQTFCDGTICTKFKDRVLRLFECYSQVQVLTHDRVELVFDDNKQKESDDKATKFEQNILSNKNFQINLETENDHLRMIQSMIEVSGTCLQDNELDIYANWIANFIAQSTRANPAFPDLVAQLLYPYFTLHLTNDTVVKHRNVCIVLTSLITEMKDFRLRADFCEQVFTYLIEIMQNCHQLNEKWLKMFSIICLGKFQLGEINKQEIRSNDKIYQLIDTISQNTFSKQPSSHPQIHENSLYQLQFCAQWFLTSVLSEQNDQIPMECRSYKNANLKLSPDLLTARSDGHWHSVRSVSSISNATKKAYFEVILHTSGAMRIGWVTKRRTNLDKNLVGDDEYSIGFDGHNRSIWHGGKQYPIAHQNVPKWTLGDVVGCLLLPDERSFVFYINGKSIPLTFVAKFASEQSYYPAASMSTFQQCRFNFVQNNHTVLFNILQNNQVEKMFNDEEQDDVDELIIQIEFDGRNDLMIQVGKEIKPLRIVQSFIELSGNQLAYDKMTVIIDWIYQLITLSAADLNFLDQLYQLLYHYFSYELTDSSFMKHRNVCIVLSSSLITTKSHLKIHGNLRKIIFAYLVEIVSNSDRFKDERLLLFSLIALGNINLDEEERKQLSTNPEILNIIKSKIIIDMNDTSSYLKHQSVFLSQWTFDNFFKSKQANKSQLYNREILDYSNCSAHLKLSPNRLSVRSDRNWQSVRSITSLNSKKYFFEVTLMTSGPMRLGWAAESVDLKETILGVDKYSIAFDGHNRCIWHRGKQLHVNNVPQWTVGDVVGCMVFLNEKKFKFYLNQQSIKLPLLALSPHFSSVKSYYAAASLFTFQQCRFNFGAKTKLKPKGTSFRVLDSARNSFRKGYSHVVNQPLQIVNSVVAYNGNLNTGNVTLRLAYPKHAPKDSFNSFINSADDTDKRWQSTSRTSNIHELENTFNEQEEEEDDEKE